MVVRAYRCRSPFSLPRPGITTADGHTIRVFAGGQTYILDEKTARKYPALQPVDDIVEQATAAPGEKRPTRRTPQPSDTKTDQ